MNNPLPLEVHGHWSKTISCPNSLLNGWRGGKFFPLLQLCSVGKKEGRIWEYLLGQPFWVHGQGSHTGVGWTLRDWGHQRWRQYAMYLRLHQMCSQQMQGVVAHTRTGRVSLRSTWTTQRRCVCKNKHTEQDQTKQKSKKQTATTKITSPINTNALMSPNNKHSKVDVSWLRHHN